MAYSFVNNCEVGLRLFHIASSYFCEISFILNAFMKPTPPQKSLFCPSNKPVLCQSDRYLLYELSQQKNKHKEKNQSSIVSRMGQECSGNPANAAGKSDCLISMF